MSSESSGPPIPPPFITRDRLADGSLLATWRAKSPPGTIRSDDELEASLETTLAGHPRGEDVVVFGYGSLMWNPAIEHVGAHRAFVRGWSRRFCLRMLLGRGSPERPGLMLALDRGGCCYGMGFRIAARQAREELRLLWRREMASGAYETRWVPADIDGRRMRALTFVVNRRHPRYTGKLPLEQVVHLLATGQGIHGNCRHYFDSTVAALVELGVRDAALERIRAALAAHAANEAAGAIGAAAS
jgi:cation transport protein ChaC